MRWREGYVPGGETRFWVRETGRGDDLALLLHGFPHDGRSWGAVARLLARGGWRVAAPDVRGVGRTTSPRGPVGARLLADELSQLVRELHADRVLVVGHGWGGAMALATAFRHPGRITGLVLVASPYRRLDLRAAWPLALTQLPVLPTLAMRVAAEPIVRHALRAHVARGSEVDPEDVRAGAAALRADPSAWLRYQRALSRRAAFGASLRSARSTLGRWSDSSGPPTLRVPAHVVWGGDDPLLPVAIGLGVASDLHASIDVLPGVGHHVPTEDPSGLAVSIDRFAQAAGLVSKGSAETAGRTHVDHRAP